MSSIRRSSLISITLGLLTVIAESFRSAYEATGQRLGGAGILHGAGRPCGSSGVED
jgi:hypothetical protein